MKKITQPTRRQRAYHEAGHAVMAHVCGLRVNRIVLLDDWKDGIGGMCESSGSSDASIRAMTALAGHVAESILTHRRPWLYGLRGNSIAFIDDGDVRDAFKAFKRSPIYLFLVRECHRQARHVLKIFWPQVRQIAYELNRTGKVSGARVRWTMKPAMRRRLQEAP